MAVAAEVTGLAADLVRSGRVEVDVGEDVDRDRQRRGVTLVGEGPLAAETEPEERALVGERERLTGIDRDAAPAERHEGQESEAPRGREAEAEEAGDLP